MSKIKFFGLLMLILFPIISHANIASLNGLNSNSQFLSTTSDSTTMHLKILESGGDTHSFVWNGIPWAVNQGGTGTTTAFTDGSLLFFSGAFSQDNSNLFWSTSSKSLGIGNSSPMHALDVAGAIYSRLVTVTPSSSVTINWNSGNVQTLTLNSANSTLSFSNAQPGGEYNLILKQDSSGGRMVTWPNSVKWPGGIAPTITTSSNAIDTMRFLYDGSSYLGTYNLNYQTTSTSSPLLNSLVSYWKLDESSGNASDSASAHTLTNVNTVTYSTGKINNAGTFSATSSQEFSLASASTGSLNLSNTDFTLNGWVKFTNLPGAGTVMSFIGKTGTNDRQYLFSLYSPSSGVYHLISEIGAGGSSSDQQDETWTPSTGVYYMVTLRYTNATKAIDFSLNGSALGTQHTSSFTLGAGNADFELGAGFQGQRFMDGQLDEWGVWNRRLSDSEITSLYNSGSGLQYPF